MIDFTPLSRPFLEHIYNAEEKARQDVERSQKATLHKILLNCGKTAYRNVPATVGYADFCEAVSPGRYEYYASVIERMVHGEADLLVPGVCRRYAQSSGTSDGKSKYIPLPGTSLQGNHYAGASYSLASYLHYYPDSHLFGGKSFILGGSFANEVEGLPQGVKVGDLSASLIDNINPVVNLFRVPSKSVALMSDWTEKLPALIKASATADVRTLSGVPSWFLAVLKGVLEYTGATEIHQVWPNLELFFHGGIAFGPYREQYNRIIDPSRMRYWENYNASEGFFAVQLNPDTSEMGLLMNAEIFYEFRDISREDAKPVPAWEVTPGTDYELIITGMNGLWRYRIGDTVRVCSTNPLTIVISGRTKCYINAFGEELMVHNAEAAMARTEAATGAEVADYTAAPVYAGDHSRGRHQWLIEFSKQPSCSLEEFGAKLDSELQKENSDYQAKRSGGIFLDPPQITLASAGLFNRWLAATGKLGGQRKVPRLSNDRKLIERMLEMNQ